MANSADPDPTDLDLPVCKDRTYSGSAGQGLRALILYEQGLKTFLFLKALSKIVEILFISIIFLRK